MVLGVSPDDAPSHRDFKEAFGLPFTLLVDTDGQVAARYGVWVKKNMFGNEYWGNARTTFLIDPAGRISRVFEKVKPEGHAADVAEAVAALG